MLLDQKEIDAYLGRKIQNKDNDERRFTIAADYIYKAANKKGIYCEDVVFLLVNVYMGRG